MKRVVSMITRTIVVLCLAGSCSVYGQGIPNRASTIRSAPSPPQLSPYFDLMRRDNSVLGPYHSFVVPRRELRKDIRRQGVQLGRLERRAVRPATGSSSSTRLRTGRGGMFNNYLHYYQFN